MNTSILIYGVGKAEFLVIILVLSLMIFSVKLIVSRRPVKYSWLILIFLFPVIGSIIYIIYYFYLKLKNQ
jgi:hypothetical protein